MPRLSIILPVLGNPSQMEESLVSVLENRPHDCEILVVLNESYDDPYDLKNEVCFIEAPRGSRLVDGINLAIAVSRAPFIHLLPCGLRVSEGWSDQALASFRDAAVAAVTPVVLGLEDPQRVVAAGVTYHAWGVMRSLGPRAAALASPADALTDPDLPVAFYRKSALDLVGRFSSKVGDQLASVDLALALRHAGFRCIVEPRCRVYATGPLAWQEGAFSRGWAAERLFWRWISTSGWFRGLPLHLLLLGTECARSLVQPSIVARLAGRLMGGLQITSHRRHWQSLKETRRHLRPASAAASAPVDPPHFALAAARNRDRGSRPLEQTQTSKSVPYNL